MGYVINNSTSYDLTQLEQLAREFLPFAQKRMGFDKSPTINFSSDEENSLNPLGKTAHYNPSQMAITIMVDKRHIKDILRSLSHELVHHNQNCRGDFNKEFSTEPGYAQNDEFLRGMEDEAYREGNFCLRDWEDGIKTSKIKNIQLKETIYKRISIKGVNRMSTKQWKDSEINSLLMEKWGYKFPEEETLENKKKTFEEEEETLEEELQAYMNPIDYRTGEKGSLEGEDEADLEEEESEDDVVVESDPHPQGVEVRKRNKSSEQKKKINKETVSYSEKLLQEKIDNKHPHTLFENWLVEAEEAEGDISKKNDETPENKAESIESSLQVTKSLIAKGEEEAAPEAVSAQRKLDILNQMCVGKGPVVDEFEKYISAALNKAYTDKKEEINAPQVDLLTRDAIKTIQTTACKTKKVLAKAGKQNRKNKESMEKAITEGLHLKDDFLLREFRAQQGYRKNVAVISAALNLLHEGKEKNIFPAIVLLNEGWVSKAGGAAGKALAKGGAAVANTAVAKKMLQKMMQRGGKVGQKGYKWSKSASQQNKTWITKPKGEAWEKLSKEKLQQAMLQRGMKPMAKSASRKKMGAALGKFKPTKAMKARLKTRLAAKEAGKTGAKGAAKPGFWKNLGKGKIFSALKVWCGKHKILCAGLGIVAALQVIGSVSDEEGLSVEKQKLMDNMTDAQLKAACEKGDKDACLELKVRAQDRAAGALPDTPNTGIPDPDGQDTTGSGGPKPKRFLGMSVKWLEGRGWKWNGVDFVKQGRPDYWLSRDHCKGVDYCAKGGRKRRKKTMVPTEPMTSEDIAITGVGGADFGAAGVDTSGMSPPTLTNPYTGNSEGLTVAGQKALMDPEVTKALEAGRKSLKGKK
jgi:hypothetical protein